MRLEDYPKCAVCSGNGYIGLTTCSICNGWGHNINISLVEKIYHLLDRLPNSQEKLQFYDREFLAQAIINLIESEKEKLHKSYGNQHPHTQRDGASGEIFP